MIIGNGDGGSGWMLMPGVGRPHDKNGSGIAGPTADHVQFMEAMMVQAIINTIAIGILLALLGMGRVPVLYAGEDDRHVQDTIKHARVGLNHEKEAIKHLEASIKASNDPHAKEALEHAKEAVKHAEESLGHAELASGQQKTQGK